MTSPHLRSLLTLCLALCLSACFQSEEEVVVIDETTPESYPLLLIEGIHNNDSYAILQALIEPEGIDAFRTAWDAKLAGDFPASLNEITTLMDVDLAFLDDEAEIDKMAEQFAVEGPIFSKMLKQMEERIEQLENQATGTYDAEKEQEIRQAKAFHRWLKELRPNKKMAKDMLLLLRRMRDDTGLLILSESDLSFDESLAKLDILIDYLKQMLQIVNIDLDGILSTVEVEAIGESDGVTNLMISYTWMDERFDSFLDVEQRGDRWYAADFHDMFYDHFGLTPASGSRKPRMLNLSADEQALVLALREAAVAMKAYKERGYNDCNADMKGEYGYLPQLCGHVGTFGQGAGKHVLPARRLALFTCDYLDGKSRLGPYRLKTYLPDLENGFLDFTQAQTLADAGKLTNGDLADRHYVIYAWSHLDESQGHIFCLIDTGQVYGTKATGDAPSWKDCFATQDSDAMSIFSSRVTWSPVNKLDKETEAKKILTRWRAE